MSLQKERSWGIGYGMLSLINKGDQVLKNTFRLALPWESQSSWIHSSVKAAHNTLVFPSQLTVWLGEGTYRCFSLLLVFPWKLLSQKAGDGILQKISTGGNG